MATSWSGWYWHLAGARLLAIGYAIAASGDCALAQIIPDGTLGSESSVVTPLAPDFPVDRIDGGAIRGANLFHSFREFNVDEGRGAYFTNPAGIENILSRVTGNDPSDILGTLGVLGNANLFLINPNGIIFGPNASLDVGGSFVATTANAVRLGDTGLFSASFPATSNLLTVNPSALFFNAVAAQAIVNQSQAQSLSGESNSLGGPVGLQVQPGKTLALIGAGVVLEGGNLTAAGGRIELGSVAGVGEVSLSQTGNSWAIGYDQIDAFGDIRIEGGLLVDASGSGGGDVQIQSARLEMTQRANIFADTLGIEAGGEVLIRAPDATTLSNSLITADVGGSGSGGNLTIETGQLTVSGEVARVSASTFGAGNAGNLTIETGQLIVEGGARVIAATFGEGSAGTLAVRTSESVELSGTTGDGNSPSGLFTSVTRKATGTGGNLTIETGRLIVRDGAGVSTTTFGEGPGGTLAVTAPESVELSGSGSALFAQTLGNKDAGELRIETAKLIVRNGAQVAASTFGQGQGGNLTVNASDFVEVSGTAADNNSGLFTLTGNAGAAGDLTIVTGKLIVQDRAFVSTESSGVMGPNGTPSSIATGPGGKLTVTASEFVELTGSSGLLTQTAGPGPAGDLTIENRQLIVEDGAQVSASTAGTGPGGKLTVTASESVELVGSQPLRTGLLTESTGSFTQIGEGDGAAGDLIIKTGQLNVRDGAEITESSTGKGNAGEILVWTRNLLLDNQAKLRASTASGLGGNINLQVPDLILMRRNSLISAEADNNGNGGNITIKAPFAPFIVAVPSENSDIIANAVRGQGGKININTQGIYGLEYRPQLTLESDINASSQYGVNGTVEINTPDVDPSLGLVALPTELVDASSLIAQTCPAGGGQGQSEFIVTGRGGLPDNPSDTLSSDAVEVDLVTLNPKVENRSSSSVSTQPTSLASGSIVEAQGWVIGANGEVILTATAPTVIPHSPGLTPTQCHTLKSAPKH